MNLNREICALLEAWTNDGRDAFAIADSMFNKIIARLQRDARFADVCRFEFELLLADVRNEAEQQLFHAIAHHVHIDDAEHAVNQCLAGNDDE
jgi:hypothetical protein